MENFMENCSWDWLSKVQIKIDDKNLLQVISFWYKVKVDGIEKKTTKERTVYHHRKRYKSKKINETLKIAKEQLTIPMVTAAMPIQDSIDLVSFLVESTIKFSKFAPGAATVGGPMEIAAITKHEGFRWVQRKHYFESKLNPCNED